MKILKMFAFVAIIALSFGSYSELKAQKTSYEVVLNDPTGLRIYTLENGLKVYLSKNTDEPKIQTFIAVRAGSNYDPKEATGLAHYLEHMVFKGTSKFGTANWEKEKEFLTKISDLYEKHKAETDPEKKKAIYKQIDEVSLEASKYAVANEYDKAVASLGATGTNAHTWFEETVYKNKIPANELDKWLNLETERFSELVLRLFHTELEAVFEEFNRGQDNDFRKQYAAMLEGLFPNHPYGQQSTIGTSEHLKNPSMIAIHNYFQKYYVPNNMALVLVGDLDFDETIKMVEKTMGTLKYKEVTHPVLPKEKPITKPIVKEVFGPTAESVSVAFRSQGIGTKEEQLLTMADMLLANGTAGLIDLNLNQKQVVQRASCSPTFLNDYGYHSFSGTPKANQSLDEVKTLLLGEIENLKQGKFEEWMLEAVINDLELSQTQRYENSSALATAYYDAFIHHEEWKNKVSFISDLRKITKQEVMDFAKGFYKENYVVTYKRKGEDKTISKVENPGITPVELNRDKQSAFIADFNKIKSKSISPVFIDYDKKIKKMKLDNGLELSYIENETNDLFNLSIILDMGKNNIKKMSHAVSYLKYVGTDKYSPEEIQKEFYKLGVSYGVSAGGERSYVYISGIKKNLDKGLELFEHLLNNAVANQDAYDKYVAKILKGRENNKTQKGRILWSGLFNYGKYGENSEARNLFSAEELKKINPKELIELVKGLTSYKQRLFYYGTGVEDAVATLNKHHKTPKKLKDYPKAKEFVELETGKKVYFVDYDMVQSEMIFLAKKDKFDVKKMALSRVFNSYFGSGLSSIVFQEIRESKSLAYSAFASYSTAGKKDKADYVFAYVGTQANKLPQAVDAMLELMNEMPKAEKQFLAAKEATLKKIAAERITKADIFWKFQNLQDKGLDYDVRKDIYEEVQKITLDDLAKFFNENIKGGNYTILVIGNKKDMQMDALKKLGEVKELEIDYLFNY
jgi:predicted Zn-dependent peptidase